PPGVRARARGRTCANARDPGEAAGSGSREGDHLQGHHGIRRGGPPDVRDLDPDDAVPSERAVRPPAGDHAQVPARGTRGGDPRDQVRRGGESDLRGRVMALNRAFVAGLDARIAQLKTDRVYKTLNYLDSPQSARVKMEGRGEVLILSSNNYLGLCDEPSAVKAGIDALGKYGAGTGS